MDAKERKLVILLTALQFVDTIEYQIVAPLAPDIANALKFSMADVAAISGAYSLCAILSSFLGVFWLDRFDRRIALCAVMLGLLLSTALTATSANFAVLLCSRLLAGLFGGLATSLIAVAVTDGVTDEHRGRALGIVMASFIVAAMVGVPTCLQLALISSWRLPFLIVAGAGTILTIVSFRVLPKTSPNPHVASATTQKSWRGILRAPVFLSCSLIASVTLTSALLVPNLSAYLQKNIGFPRAQLGLLYMLGATASFVAFQFAGRLNDKFGTFAVVATSHLLLAAILSVAFIFPGTGVSVWVWFAMLNVAFAGGFIATSAFVTIVPQPHERGAFMSAITGVRHGAIVVGTLLSTQILDVTPDGTLRHVWILGIVSTVFALLSPFFVASLNRRRVEDEPSAVTCEVVPHDLSTKTARAP